MPVAAMRCYHLRMDVTLILASASSRRRRLIAWLGPRADSVATDIAEDLTLPLPPAELAASLATEKARAAGLPSDTESAMVLAFDTIVAADGRVLGKPADEAEARAMLAQLSGRTHDVLTGVAIAGPGMAEPVCFTVTTPVLMRELDEVAISQWLERGEYLGCAGAYNIEHHLASVADDECFQSVAGLPLCHLYRALADGMGGAVPAGLRPPVDLCDAALGRTCGLGPRVCGRPAAR